MIDPAPTPCTRALAKERIEQLENALSQLPAEARQLIVWRNGERLSFQQIGEYLNCTPEAARKRWVRTIAQLRGMLPFEP